MRGEQEGVRRSGAEWRRSRDEVQRCPLASGEAGWQPVRMKVVYETGRSGAPKGLVAAVIGCGSQLSTGESLATGIACRRRPGKRACGGWLDVVREVGSGFLLWGCERCGDSGRVTTWEGSEWDRSKFKALRDGGLELVLTADEVAAGRAMLGVDLEFEAMFLAARRWAEARAFECRLPLELMDLLCDAVAAEANHTEISARLTRLESLYEAVERALGREGDRRNLNRPSILSAVWGNVAGLVGGAGASEPGGGPRRFLPVAGEVGGVEIRVELLHVRPAIWRTLELPGNLTLAGLHEVLQAAMGWLGEHLHQFSSEVGTFGDVEVLDQVQSSEAVALSQVLVRSPEITYLYDFGDGWEHRITLEAIVPEAQGGGRVLDGARACPPEDCGGPWGYEELLEALRDPEEPEHQDRVEWAPEGFDAEAWDLEACRAAVRAVLVGGG